MVMKHRCGCTNLWDRLHADCRCYYILQGAAGRGAAEALQKKGYSELRSFCTGDWRTFVGRLRSSELIGWHTEYTPAAFQ